MAIHQIPVDLYEPNDSPGACSPLNVPPSHTQPGLSIHEPADLDWFCFSLPSRGTDWQVTVDILFIHAVGNLDMDLFDDQLNLLAFSQSSTDDEHIDIQLPAGDYFLRVFPFIGLGPPNGPNIYDLSVSAQ